MKKVGIGVVGCGNISGIYLKNASKFDLIEVVACADLVRERAEDAAEEYGVPRVLTVEELLQDPEVEIVCNLTPPGAHAEVCLTSLKAGKNVYVEKPLAVEREDGRRILKLAEKKGLLLGGAPDTFFGGGIQTCRKLIDDGWIGKPVAATAFMMGHGHESWHPDPEFYYKPGGGPMFDMGPYYLTALINLIGPIRRVTGSASITFPQRTITSEPKYGEVIEVETPTHIAGIIDFDQGAVGTIITSFDVWGAQLPRIEIYGEEGSLSVPDPNGFGGPVSLLRPDEGSWKEVPLTHGYTENSRGLGVLDMAYALRTGRNHRASGELVYHVLDVMQGFLDAAEEGTHYEVESGCLRPEPLPMGLRENTLDT